MKLKKEISDKIEDVLRQLNEMGLEIHAPCVGMTLIPVMVIGCRLPVQYQTKFTVNFSAYISEKYLELDED